MTHQVNQGKLKSQLPTRHLRRGETNLKLQSNHPSSTSNSVKNSFYTKRSLVKLKWYHCKCLKAFGGASKRQWATISVLVFHILECLRKKTSKRQQTSIAHDHPANRTAPSQLRSQQDSAQFFGASLGWMGPQRKSSHHRLVLFGAFLSKA